MKLYPLTLALVLALGAPAQLWAQEDLSFDEFASGDDSEEEVKTDDGSAAAGGTTAADSSADTSADSGGGGQAAAAASSDAGEATAEGEELETEESIGQPLSERIKAVSRKFFLKKSRFELTPAVGLSINDAFFRNYIAQVDATYHIIEPFAVELRVGGSFLGEPLEPVRFLHDEFTVLEKLIRPIYMADLSGTFTPLYGKTSLFADWIWHYDMYVAGGLGVTGVARLGGSNLAMEALFHQPTLNVGGGMRGFVTKWMVVHLDVRDYVFLYPYAAGETGSDNFLSDVQNLLVLTAGVGIYFPFDFEHEDG